MARRQQLLEDFENVKKKYDSTKNSPLKDINLDDETLFFAYEEKSGKIEMFTLQIATYPDSCLLFLESGEVKTVTGTLLSIVNNIVAGCKGDPSANIGQDYDFGGSYKSIGDDIGEDRYKLNKKLMVDIQNYKTLYGSQNIDLRLLPLLETLEIDLLLPPCDVISPSTARGWGIDPALPIVIKIPVSDLYYTDSSKPPKIEIYQKEKDIKKNLGLKSQLEGIMETFVSAKWPGKPGNTQYEVQILDEKDIATTIHKSSKKSSSGKKITSKETLKTDSEKKKTTVKRLSHTPKKSPETIRKSSEKKSPRTESTLHKKTESTTKTTEKSTGSPTSTTKKGNTKKLKSEPPETKIPDSVKKTDVEALIGMGYGRDIAIQALVMEPDLNSAATLLLEHPEKILTGGKEVVDNFEKKKIK